MRSGTAIALLLLIPLLASAAASDEVGLISRESAYPVAETVERIESTLMAKGVKVFARIDHDREAASAGLELRPTVLLIVGNPKVGTPLMAAAPTMGIDLPLRILVWQDDQDRAQVVWNDPDYLAKRHGLDPAAGKALAPMGGLIEAAIR